jgi:hypothetical protein
MTITSVSINGTSFAQGSEPVLNKGAGTSNSFTINGTGFSGNQAPGDISFSFPGYTPAANSISSQSTIQITGTFIFNPGASPPGSDTQSSLAITVAGAGGPVSYPGVGTYPVKIRG